MPRNNLNDTKWNYAFLHSPHANGEKELEDNSTNVSGSMYVETHFKNLDQALIHKIEKAQAVVGCVAWLTHKGILEALSKCQQGVSIVVQKEDFLRPDLGHSSSFNSMLQTLYSQLNPIGNLGEHSFSQKADYDDSDYDNWFENSREWVDVSSRCVGYKKRDNEFTMPRMHHKFLVFCKHRKIDDYLNDYIPYAVWTGSFNMTKNGAMSLENGIYIENTEIARSYFKEWFNILMISEPLDWTSEWVAPDIHLLDDSSCIS